MEYLWLSLEIVTTIHGELLYEHGGLPGPPKPGTLEGTLARPQNLLAYAHTPPDLAQLAASYAFGFARNHCFPDGNKRTALASIDVFLRMNDQKLAADETDAVAVILAVATGAMSEEQLAEWIRQFITPI